LIVTVLAVIAVVLMLGCVKQLDVPDLSGGFVTHFGWIRGAATSTSSAGCTRSLSAHARTAEETANA
jgi:hypothetical protein